MPADRRSERMHDPQTGRPHRGVIIRGVLARSVTHDDAVLGDKAAFRVPRRQPDRRCCRGRAKHHPKSGTVQLIHHPQKKVEREVTLVRLHLGPSELPHADHRDPKPLHLVDVTSHLRLRPELRIVGDPVQQRTKESFGLGHGAKQRGTQKGTGGFPTSATSCSSMS